MKTSPLSWASRSHQAGVNKPPQCFETSSFSFQHCHPCWECRLLLMAVARLGGEGRGWWDQEMPEISRIQLFSLNSRLL